jgi:predicted phosphodiesterase
MKIAFFSDIHGNDEALAAILADIDRQHVDRTVCAGDAVNPFPGSTAVWETIKALNIPMVRGNHEDYMLAFHDPANHSSMRGNVQYLPIQFAAERLSKMMIAEMANLPMTLTMPGPSGDDVLVCHASPDNTRRSFARHLDEAMAASLSLFSERVVVGGHIHMQWQKRWQGKLLILCGGAGLPLNGDPAAQYVILTHRNSEWDVEHRAVPYDHASMLQKVRESGFLDQGGPIGWLIYDELWTAERRIVPFLENLGSKPEPSDQAGWQTVIREYLETIGRWEYLAPYVLNGSITVSGAMKAASRSNSI